MTYAPEIPKKLYDAWVLSQKTQQLEPTNALVFQCALKMYLVLNKIANDPKVLKNRIVMSTLAHEALKAVDTELVLHPPIPVHTFETYLETVLGEEDGIVVDETGGATDYVGETK